MTLEELENLPHGTKVIYTFVNKHTKKWDSEIYDFGYVGQTGRAIVYNEGECNMQDAHAVDPDRLTLLKNCEKASVVNLREAIRLAIKDEVDVDKIIKEEIVKDVIE